MTVTSVWGPQRNSLLANTIINVAPGPSSQLTNGVVLMAELCDSCWCCSWNAIINVGPGPPVQLNKAYKGGNKWEWLNCWIIGLWPSRLGFVSHVQLIVTYFHIAEQMPNNALKKALCRNVLASIYCDMSQVKWNINNLTSLTYRLLCFFGICSLDFLGWALHLKTHCWSITSFFNWVVLLFAAFSLFSAY